MPLGREIPLRAGGLAIDLTCKLTVVLSTNTYVEKGYFMVCVPFNREFDRWLDANDSGDLSGFLHGQNWGWARAVHNKHLMTGPQGKR